MELAGLESPGKGKVILEKHHGAWHRWEQQVVSMDQPSITNQKHKAQDPASESGEA